MKDIVNAKIVEILKNEELYKIDKGSLSGITTDHIFRITERSYLMIELVERSKLSKEDKEFYQNERVRFGELYPFEISENFTILENRLTGNSLTYQMRRKHKVITSLEQLEYKISGVEVGMDAEGYIDAEEV